MIWVDLDAYCLRPYRPREGYLFGGAGDEVLTGVLALPQDSPGLGWMSTFLAAPQLIPPWRPADWVARRLRQGRAGAFDLPWGDVGPRLVAHALRESGEIAHMSAPRVFYPVIAATLSLLWRDGARDEDIIRPETDSVHIFGYTKRVLATYHAGLPPPGSWLARRAAHHGLDPAASPATGESLLTPG